MHFVSIVSTLLLAGAAFAQERVPATFDNKYDNPRVPMKTVACSKLARKYPFFGSLPSFPSIGGVKYITAPNSENCGTCWQLTCMITGNQIYVTAIDMVDNDGVIISQKALDTVTNGNSANDSILLAPVQVDASNCGL